MFESNEESSSEYTDDVYDEIYTNTTSTIYTSSESDSSLSNRDQEQTDVDVDLVSFHTYDAFEELENEIDQIYEDNSYVIDRIYSIEADFLDKEKLHNEMYIGFHFSYHKDPNMLLANAVSNTTFFDFPLQHIEYYLLTFNMIPLQNPKTQIMKLQIQDTESSHQLYTVVLKTYWIRLVQRHWKTLMKERKKKIKQRASITSRQLFENTGKYTYEINFMPRLKGMLSMYSS